MWLGLAGLVTRLCRHNGLDRFDWLDRFHRLNDVFAAIKYDTVALDSFACDGTMQNQVGKLRWTSVGFLLHVV